MLIPVKYHKRAYPPYIKPQIDEIAAHFDISNIKSAPRFSLHTEYSYGSRKFDTQIIKQFPVIIDANKNGVPQLWFTKQWALNFADFIITLCNNSKPEVIEIHPPFSDYTVNIEAFIEIYKVFEAKIVDYSTTTKIVIENRTGSMYRGGKFLISQCNDLLLLSKHIKKNNLKLRIALDIPQLISRYGGPPKLTKSKLYTILSQLTPISSVTQSIHLWGKRRSASGRKVSHIGDLNSYFEDDLKKEIFLEWFADFVNDGLKRYFVPEVNSSDEDLHSIINDLESKGIQFNSESLRRRQVNLTAESKYRSNIAFEQLAHFIENKMRMSHIYQPVMIMELLSNGGVLKDIDIAKSFLAYDPRANEHHRNQIEFYTDRTNNMVGRVLQKHSIVTWDRTTHKYHLIGFDRLSKVEIEELKEKCINKLDDFLERRGIQVFNIPRTR